MTATDPILDGLNTAQFEAVTAPDGPLLIVAGAGTGKTRVITRRLAMLVRDRGVRPFQVFAATFTNKAADEMKKRVAELCRVADLGPPEFHISTFHSLCARILRREAATAGLDPNFTICDDRDQHSAVKHVMRQLGIPEKELKPADAQHVINQCKMRMLGPESVEEVNASVFTERYSDIYRAYVNYLRESGAVDFEDLIWSVVKLWQQNPENLASYHRRYRHVLVDEYQDTNAVQVELVSLLAASHRNLCVVGDEDQSIYSWRGADIANLLGFQKHFPEARTIRLERNYRSTGNILKAASTVIARNTERLGKTLFTEDGDGAPVYLAEAYNETDESRAVAYGIEELVKRHGMGFGDIAVFYRVSALSRLMEDRMREFRFPYRVIGGMRFYDRAEVKDLLSYMQVVANPGNSIALLRVINTPKRSLGAKTVQAIVDHAESRGMTVYAAARDLLKSAADAFPKATARKLGDFLTQIQVWREHARDHKASEVFQKVLEETLYVESLGDPKDLENQSRIDNLQEMLSSIVVFERDNPGGGLTEFLENVSLAGATDDLEPGAPAVSLMTLHAAKGLEYKAVFIVGLEEGIFPSARAVNDRGDYEEERRLFYVGITRARTVLTLTRARSRVWYGEVRMNPASHFLRELPTEVLAPLDGLNPDFRIPRGDDADEPHWAPDDDDAGAALAQITGAPAARSGVNAPSPPADRYRRGTLAQPGARAVIPPAAARGIALGSRVRHPLLGEGTISGISGSGAETRLLFHSDDGTQIDLLARYARLEVLTEP